MLLVLKRSKETNNSNIRSGAKSGRVIREILIDWCGMRGKEKKTLAEKEETDERRKETVIARRKI